MALLPIVVYIPKLFNFQSYSRVQINQLFICTYVFFYRQTVGKFQEDGITCFRLGQHYHVTLSLARLLVTKLAPDNSLTIKIYHQEYICSRLRYEFMVRFTLMKYMVLCRGKVCQRPPDESTIQYQGRNIQISSNTLSFLILLKIFNFSIIVKFRSL